MQNRVKEPKENWGKRLHMKGAFAVLWVTAFSNIVVAQKANKSVEEGFTSGDFLGYAMFFMAGMGILGTMIYLLKKSRLAISRQTAEASAQEIAFADKVIRDLGGAPQGNTPPRPAFDIKAGITADSPIKPYKPQPIRVPQPVSGPSAGSDPSAHAPPPLTQNQPRPDVYATDVEDLARRLMGLNILADREGKFQLAVPPDAPIHRIRRGGIAVLLPRLESEAVMAHLVNRFDIVFAITTGGEVLVLSRLQTRLVELLDNPGAGGSGSSPFGR